MEKHVVSEQSMHLITQASSYPILAGFSHMVGVDGRELSEVRACGWEVGAFLPVNVSFVHDCAGKTFLLVGGCAMGGGF